MTRTTAFRQSLLVLAMLACLVPAAAAQQVFDIEVDSAEYFTDIGTEMGRSLKFLVTDDRLVALDFENYRALFYQRGTGFDDNTLIKIVGTHSRAQEDYTYDSLTYNRLSREFTGVIFRDTVWITSYRFGEIIKFDLDGNHVGTIPGKYRVLDVSDTVLYAFQQEGIYRLDSAGTGFDYLRDIPEFESITSDEWGANVEIEGNILCLSRTTVLDAYDLDRYIADDTLITLFTKSTAVGIPDFEIMPGKLVWCPDYAAAYRVCDLSGNAIDSGLFPTLVNRLQYQNGDLWVAGMQRLVKYDTAMNELTQSDKDHIYTSGQFLGADSLNLYFYSYTGYGLMIAPLDFGGGTFLWDRESSIHYSAWNREFREAGNLKFVLVEWPPDSFYVHRFDIDAGTRDPFPVPWSQGLYRVGDTIIVLSTNRINKYDFDGNHLGLFWFSNLAGSNLSGIDSTSALKFAANSDWVFVAYQDKLNVLSHTGVFDRMYDLPFNADNSDAHLFATATHVIGNAPVLTLDVATGQLDSQFVYAMPGYGYLYGDYYVHPWGGSAYAIQTLVPTGVDDQEARLPDDFGLEQNFPNPFNAETRIRFHLERPAEVKVEVFNVLGQRVRTLGAERLEPGVHVWDWDGTDDAGRGLASGVYFYRLIGPPRSETRQMLLLK